MLLRQSKHHKPPTRQIPLLELLRNDHARCIFFILLAASGAARVSGFAGWKDWDYSYTVMTGKKPVKAHKFHATKTEFLGIVFDSKREAARYSALLIRGLAGEIADLELQPRFELHVNGIRVGKFTADFGYVELTTGQRVIEDVKSQPTKTEAYRLRKRVVEALYGIQITEVL